MWTYFRLSGRSTIIGQRSTSPRRNASSELVPVSTHCRDTPARRAASLTVSTASPEKPLGVRICTGGTCSKPMRRVRCGIRGVRMVKYQNAIEAANPTEVRINSLRLAWRKIESTIKTLLSWADPSGRTFHSDRQPAYRKAYRQSLLREVPGALPLVAASAVLPYPNDIRLPGTTGQNGP